MKWGFTGTRIGLTSDQSDRLRRLFAERELPDEFHHGDCVGADAEAHRMIWQIYLSVRAALRPMVIIHPPVNSKYRAFLRGHITHEELPYLIRNKAIVHDTDILIACPATRADVRRSGTWATIRYAQKVGKPVIFVWPTLLDGR